MFNEHITSVILHCCAADAVDDVQQVQTLWSGYGAILRVHLHGGSHPSVILKQVTPPETLSHPRGWASQRSDARKRQSYAVEAHWYQHYAGQCPADCRVPQALHVERDNDGALLILEDLQPHFPHLRQTATLDDVGLCLRWLARFHAHGFANTATGLWPTGCYWHLQTRPDELAAMPDGKIKDAAHQLDARLQECPYQTVVHGDAKLANFCFSQRDNASGGDVAAVDFQYVGRGPGIRDVAYFLGSALDDTALHQHTDALVDQYFKQLSDNLPSHIDAADVVREWQPLLPIAWTDFTRFLLGWAPTHTKLNDFSALMAARALHALEG